MKVSLAMLVLAAGVVLALRESRTREPMARSRNSATVTPGDRLRNAAKRVEAERPRALERLKAIQEELRELSAHAWAGVYGLDEPNGETVRISLAPKSGLTYIRASATGIDDVNDGDISRAENDSIHVQFVTDPESNEHALYLRKSLSPVDDVFFVVRWGSRRYLIAQSWMQAFCNAVNDGTEVRSPHFPYLLSAGAADPLGAKPEVSLAYKDWLLEQPLEGEVIKVGDGAKLGLEDEHRLQLPLAAWVNLGSARGLAPGMVVWLADHPAYAEGEVINVEEQRARVEFRFAVGNTLEPARLKPGWKVSTLKPVAPASK